MLKDFKEKVDEIAADSGFVPYWTLDVYREGFEFGENIPSVVAHLSVELEKAARLLHSHVADERRSGFYRAKEVGEALDLLTRDVDPWNMDGAKK